MAYKQRHEEKGTGGKGITDNALPIAGGLFYCIKKGCRRQHPRNKYLLSNKKFGNITNYNTVSETLEACYGKKAGPPFPADPKEKTIIKLKEKFGNGDIITHFPRQEKPFMV